MEAGTRNAAFCVEKDEVGEGRQFVGKSNAEAAENEERINLMSDKIGNLANQSSLPKAISP